MTTTLKPFKTPNPELLNLRGGAISSDGSVTILAGLKKLEDEDTAHTVVLRWTGQEPWLGALLEWTSNSVCLAAKPTPAVICSGMDGVFAKIEGEALAEGEICVGTVTSVQSIAGRACAVGTGGKVLLFEGDQWRALAGHVKEGPLFHAAAGPSEAEIYAVGSDGELLWLDQGAPVRLSSPTRAALTSACVGADGNVYTCGQRGVVLRGRRDAWSLVDHGITNEDLWGIRCFQGRVFVSSVLFLYELRGDSLEQVQFEDERPSSFCHLSSMNDEVMISVGKSDAFLFDGRAWTRLI